MPSEEEDDHTIKVALQYANGYRELGMHKDAIAELGSLPQRLSTSETVLEMKLLVLMDAKDWKRAHPISKELADRYPEKSSHRVNYAYVTRRSKTLKAAKEILVAAIDRFPNEAILHYNLGCYACQEDNIEGAREELVRAFSLDIEFLDTAKKDEDLEPLREWLDGLEIA